MPPDQPTRVLILAGGTDAERSVSLDSAAHLHAALSRAPDIHPTIHTLDTPTPAGIDPTRTDIVWPMLHGPNGEGGPTQDILEQLDVPYVGSRPTAARLAMDKLASKVHAAAAGFTTPDACVLRVDDPTPPFPLPLVVKPIAEGSTLGLHICKSADQWRQAHDEAHASRRPTMVERFAPGREFTIALIDQRVVTSIAPPTHTGSAEFLALPPIEIVPHAGFYDFAAKYQRDDTRYIVHDKPNSPELDRALANAARHAVALTRRLDVRHLARVDIIVDAHHNAHFLEINTMPGFTAHSLLPMAAQAIGLDTANLGARMIQLAIDDHRTRPNNAADTIPPPTPARNG